MMPLNVRDIVKHKKDKLKNRGIIIADNYVGNRDYRVVRWDGLYVKKEKVKNLELRTPFSIPIRIESRVVYVGDKEIEVIGKIGSIKRHEILAGESYIVVQWPNIGTRAYVASENELAVIDTKLPNSIGGNEMNEVKDSDFKVGDRVFYYHGQSRDRIGQSAKVVGFSNGDEIQMQLVIKYEDGRFKFLPSPYGDYVRKFDNSVRFRTGDRVYCACDSGYSFAGMHGTVISFHWGVNSIEVKIQWDCGRKFVHDADDPHIFMPSLNGKVIMYESPGVQHEKSKRFKKGDKIVHPKIPEEVYEFIGYTENGNIAFFDSNGIVQTYTESRFNLCEEPKKLVEGQEVWIRAKIRELPSRGFINADGVCCKDPIMVTIGSTFSCWASVKNIFVKNDEGQIVPFEGQNA